LIESQKSGFSHLQLEKRDVFDEFHRRNFLLSCQLSKKVGKIIIWRNLPLQDFSGEEKKPKYQRAIISTSLVIFMLYFFVFREENDLDRQMKKPLWEKVPGLERQTLQALIEYNKKNGKDNTATEARMVQLLAEEAAGLGPSLRKPAAVRPVLVVAGKPIA
jgi:CCSMST1 family